MKKIIYKLRYNCLAILGAIIFLTSCNKDLEQFAAIPTPVYPSGNRIAATLAADANYSFYNALITRAGLTATLNDSTKSFTLFATDNAGMKLFVTAASGGAVPPLAPDAAFLGFISTVLPAASAAGIVQYNTVGQKLPFASISSAFPNYPYTSQIILDPAQPFVRMPIFPARGTPYSYVNTMPVISTDKAASNGVIHTTFSLVAPLPTLTLRQLIAAESTLSYFRAAILRADSGQVVKPNNDSTNFLNYLLGYAVTNMTVLPPNDAAMQPVLFGALYQGLYPIVFSTIYNTAIAGGATPAQATALATAQAPAATTAQATALAATPAGFNFLPVASVRGIMAYHFLASNSTPVNTTGSYKPDIRVFSVNVPATPTAIKTLVNGGVANHPGVTAQATFTGPVATALRFTGAGNGGVASNAVAFDKHALNGVYHILDRVLLPQ